jgi:hypothetical protein
VNRSWLLFAVSVVAAGVLVAAYLAAGGSDYEPAKIQDPCEPREWRDPGSLEERAEQFALSALDGAACELRVSRETLARVLATEETRRRFAEEYGIGDEQLEEAVRAGLVRAIDDAEDAGALPSVVAGPLREFARRIPVDEGIALINDARPLFEGAGRLMGELGDRLPDGIELPGEIERLIP